MKSLLLIAVAAILVTIPAHSQDLRFGKVTEDEVKMKTYSKDPSAHAVILCDRGVLNGPSSTFTRYRRLKVLTPAGTSYSNFTLSVPSKSDIRGLVHNYENGEVTKERLESSAIYKEEIIQGITVYKIFFPNVKTGSVIELEYSFVGVPYEWRFQDRIPIVRSELQLDRTEYINYKKTFYGFYPVQQKSEYMWLAEDVPALTDEPYMGHYSNYLTRFEFDLSNIHAPTLGVYWEYSTTWEKVTEKLMEYDNFGGIIRGFPPVNDKANELENSSLTVPEKVDQAYQWIRQNIKWNKVHSLVVSTKVHENFKRNHTGNSAEVNLPLLVLLKKAGINAYPVVMSTRSNGLANPLSASISKLNHVLVYVNHDNYKVMLDATSPYTIPGMLPDESLNLSAWVMLTRYTGEWIDLNPAKGNVVRQYIRISPNANNELTADITNTYEGYAFLDWIRKFDEQGTEEAFSNYMRSEKDLSPQDKYAIKTIDRAKLKTVENVAMNLTGTSYLEDLGKEFILNPFVLTDLDNPFKAESRSFPIDFMYARNRSSIISITIPPGHEVTSAPESYNLIAPDGSVKIAFLCNVVGSTVNMKVDFNIAKPIFAESDYAALRTIFADLLRKMNEPIQVTKKS